MLFPNRRLLLTSKWCLYQTCGEHKTSAGNIEANQLSLSRALAPISVSSCSYEHQLLLFPNRRLPLTSKWCLYQTCGEHKTSAGNIEPNQLSLSRALAPISVSSCSYEHQLLLFPNQLSLSQALALANVSSAEGGSLYGERKRKNNPYGIPCISPATAKPEDPDGYRLSPSLVSAEGFDLSALFDHLRTPTKTIRVVIAGALITKSGCNSSLKNSRVIKKG